MTLFLFRHLFEYFFRNFRKKIGQMSKFAENERFQIMTRFSKKMTHVNGGLAVLYQIEKHLRIFIIYLIEILFIKTLSRLFRFLIGGLL